MTLRYLYVDFNSYFASVEQFDQPELRDRPLAVTAVDTDTTCCLAASQQAKACGIRTGTGIIEARRMCPDLVVRVARPARYVQLHHQLMELIQSCVPHEQANSIDEVACALIGRERERGNAEAIARQIKQKLQQHYGSTIRCSIGIAPNRFLAKTATDMQKPDGLVVIEQTDLPQALHRLQLRELCGIGPAMEQRLLKAGIRSVARLCTASPRELRAIWGGIEGERYWAGLHGIDLPPRRTTTSSIGHSHVLAPALRTRAGMRSVAFKLLAKAAMRLRDKQLLAGMLHAHVRFVGMESRLDAASRFAPIDDTRQLLQQLDGLLQPATSADGAYARLRPLSISVTLSEFQPATGSSAQLFEDPRKAALNGVLDQINARYGNNKLYFATMQTALEHDAAPMRIPFQHVPSLALEQEAEGNALWAKRLNQHNSAAEQYHRERQRKRMP
jgi:DNA polymerase-4